MRKRHEGLATVVLAAGAGTRFGAVKQLAELEGQPLLARVLAAAAGFAEEELVVVGANAAAVEPLVRPPWRPVPAPDWERGIGASLRAGLAAIPEIRAALVLLADVPWLRPEAIERVLAAAARSDAAVLRACEGEVPGHPVLMRGAALDRARHAPDAGLAAVLASTRVEAVECGGLGVALDVDRPEDLERERILPS